MVFDLVGQVHIFWHMRRGSVIKDLSCACVVHVCSHRFPLAYTIAY